MRKGTERWSRSSNALPARIGLDLVRLTVLELCGILCPVSTVSCLYLEGPERALLATLLRLLDLACALLCSALPALSLSHSNSNISHSLLSCRTGSIP